MRKEISSKVDPVESLRPPEIDPAGRATKQRLPTAEILARAEEWLLRKLNCAGRPHFTTIQTWESWHRSELRRPFGLEKDDERDPHEILLRVCTGLRERLKSARLEYDARNHRSWSMNINLSPGCEWRDYWRDLHELLKLPPEAAADMPTVVAANPVCDLAVEHASRADLQGYREMIVELILKQPLVGNRPFVVWHVASRREFERCFPLEKLGRAYDGVGRRLAEFFRHLVPPPCLLRSFDVQDDAEIWHYTIRPRTTWEETLVTLEAERKRPGLDVRYGISPQSAALLEWLLALPADRLESGWSPSVENCNTREIGLNHPGGEESFPFYLQLLLDEINECTGYRVRSFSWKEYNSNRTRLKLTEKPSELDEIVRQIQWHALRRNRMLESGTVRAALMDLLGPQMT